MKSEPQTLSSSNESNHDPIQFVDGHFFFCRRLDLPEAITPEEIPAFVELSLEELSPFPIDQLAWGWLRDASLPAIFLYAACRPRLPGDVVAAWPEARHVFPAFLPFLLTSRTQQTMVAVRSNGSLTLMRFAAGHSLPSQILSEPLSSEADDASVQNSLATMRQRMKVPASLPQAALFAPGHATIRKHALEFIPVPLTPASSSEPTTPRLEDQNNLWQADIREDAFIIAERKRRQTEGRVDKALAGAGIAAVLLLLLLLFNSFGGWMVSRREALVERQGNAVYNVQQNSDFLVQLEQFSGDPFHPFGILAAANAVLLERQPRRIEFRSVAVASNNEVVIQGESPNVEEVNLFSDRLRRSGFFSSVELADVRTRAGQVSFSLNLRYIPGTFPPLQPEPEISTEVTETSEALASNPVPEEIYVED